jgi:hypothetical protein
VSSFFFKLLLSTFLPFNLCGWCYYFFNIILSLRFGGLVPVELTYSSISLVQENILKIRKVYDAFLAEFPLCYGYWKKYADHEAHLGSVDKVVEVYERAVQGVTYSVDMWLHYCIFAISTYGDPDTVRR